MRVAKFSYIALALLIASTVLSPCVQALVSVTDSPGIKQNIKNTMQSIKESKIVTDSVAFAKKTSTTIGDAKKSVTEYVIKNKKKVEEKVKKAKEYKERAEKYKKEYNEYKKQYEKYKSEAESGIAEAKGAVNTAKDVAGGLQDMAQSKLDKTGLGGDSSIGGDGSTTEGGSADGEDNAENVVVGDSSTEAVGDDALANSSAVDVQNSALAIADANTLNDQKAKIAVDSSTAVSARQPFVNGNAEPARSDSAPQVVKALVAERGDVAVSEASATKALVAPAVKAQAFQAQNATTRAVMPQKFITPSRMKAQTAVEDSAVLKPEMKTLKKAPISKQKTPMRRGFKALEQRSNLQGLTGFATLNQTAPLVFASIMGMSDGGVNQDGDMIIPSSLAMSCDIGSADALKKGVLDACMVRINDMQKGAQIEQPENGAALYHKGLRTYAAAYIAEAVKAKNDTESFTDKVVDPIDFADTTTEMDDYANIGEMSKAITTTINGLLKIHSTELAMDIYQNYGTYKFSSPPKDEE